MRRLFAPLRPDLDSFLFAAVGEEIDGIPLSMISALTRLGLDPWDEASRLASLGKQEAIEQLARMIGRLPGAIWPAVEVAKIARGLVDLLPRRDTTTLRPAEVRPSGRGNAASGRIKLWLIGLILAAAALVGVIGIGGLPFAGHQPPEAAPTTETPKSSR